MNNELVLRKVTAIFTPRKHLRVGSVIILANSPVLEIHCKGDEDLLTVDELLYLMYKKQACKIIFEDGTEAKIKRIYE